MKRFAIHLLLLGLGLSLGPSGRVSGAGQAGEVIGRIHYVGLERRNADGGGTVFKSIAELPASGQLRADTLDKVAQALSGFFRAKGNGGTASPIRILRPLLNDVGAAETMAEAIEHAPRVLEVTLALRLDDRRLAEWRKSLGELVAAWEPQRGLAAVAYTATNSWVAWHCLFGPEGTDKSLVASSLYQKVRQGERPTTESGDYWLRAEADLGRWAARLFKQSGKNLPSVDLTVAGRRDNLRSEAKLTFRDAVASRVERWKIPSETIRDPLVSFSCIQGISGWLARQPLIQELGLNDLPNQLFLWGLSQTVFQFQAAAPVANANDLYSRIHQKWIPRWNTYLEKFAIGAVNPVTNRVELIWRGLPILVPYLDPLRDHGQEYLHAGIFPVKPPTNQPPFALFQQLSSRTNLVYYDWEITQDQLGQLRPLLQVASAFLTLSPMSTNSSAYKWLDAIEPRLGNMVTEVTANSPRELTLVRTSPLGLNGLELLTLANWLEGTNFPHLNLDVHFRPVVVPNQRQSKR